MAKKAANSGKRKRKVSGKRGTAKRGQPVNVKGVIGVLAFCLGLLALACQFVPSSGGFLLYCRQFVRGMGGSLCLLLPIVVCWAGIVLALFAEKSVNVRLLSCGAILFVLAESFLHLFRINEVVAGIQGLGKTPGYGSFILQSYAYSAQTCSGGGFLGALLAWPLHAALDVWGSMILIVCLCVVVLMVMTGFSFGGVGMMLSEWLDDWRVSLNERREEKRALREKREEELGERERQSAEARKQKRIERERRQSEIEAKLREEEEQRAAQKKEQPRARKARQAPPSAAQEEYAQDTPEQPEPVQLRTAPGDAYETERTLFIEREDAFERGTLEDREREENPRPSFTLEEAENAFLYGMDHVPPQTAEQPYGAPARESGSPARRVRRAQPQFSQPEPQEEPQSAQYAEPEHPASEPMGEEPQEAVWTPPEEEPYEPEDELPAYTPAQEGGSVPYSIPANPSSRSQNVLERRGQDVLAAQRPEEQVIVQLRGERLDGTPMVRPAKELHEAPIVPEDEYVCPPIELLNKTSSSRDPNQHLKDEEGFRKLIETLESFGVQAKRLNVTHGPAITRYEIQPAPGVKVSRIVNLVDDIALNMASDGVRIEAPIPGKPAVGIEIPNEKIEMVSLRDVLESPEMKREKSPTAVALGKSISGSAVVADMAKMPHVLIAGATGSGKSVCINTIINSIIYRASPREVRLILIDPKVVELSVYNGIPHLLVPVVTDPKKASAALSWAVVEMEHRYKRFETMGVRDIRGYNNAIGPEEEPMAKIIVIIDELADLMMVAPGEVEESICRLAQLARAAGIHLVIATQRPSVNVITGVIKANIPSRIAFAVSSQIDSRTILDAGGAEKLLGKGDMLYAPQGAGKPTRVQGCFVSDDEVQRIVDYVRGQHNADYNEDVIEQMNSVSEEEKDTGGEAPAAGEPVDEMLSKAIELAIDAGQVSISMLQRRLRVGYARAGRLVDEMTLRGITAEAEGPTKPRTVLISREEWRRMQENQE